MSLAIKELWDIGFFECLVNFSNIYLSAAIWACIFIGMGIQYLLTKKCRSKIARHSLVITAAVAALVCEFICQAMTGWDMLGWLIIYGLVVVLLIGAVLVCAVRFILTQFNGK